MLVVTSPPHPRQVALLAVPPAGHGGPRGAPLQRLRPGGGLVNHGGASASHLVMVVLVMVMLVIL